MGRLQLLSCKAFDFAIFKVIVGCTSVNLELISSLVDAEDLFSASVIGSAEGWQSVDLTGV